jgi:integrase
MLRTCSSSRSRSSRSDTPRLLRKASAPRMTLSRRAGGRESRTRYGGSFPRKAEAVARRNWINGELASLRIPDFSILAEPAAAPTLRTVAERWQLSRVDVRESTRIQHRTALGRVLPVLGERPVDTLTPGDVAELVGRLADEGKARESIRKSVTALAMALDFAGIAPNPARDRVQVRLPREEPEEPEPPSAEHVEAVAWLLTVPYLIGLLTLDATGVRVGELEAARIGDLDESRKAWLVRARVAKTRRARWAELPDDLYAAVVERLPAHEDRNPTAPLFPGVTADRLRMAIGRGCRDAGVPHFAPHALRHRRISLLHRQGVSWAEIGERVGQRSRVVTADRYTHALVDYREVDRANLLGRARNVPTSVPTPAAESTSIPAAF